MVCTVVNWPVLLFPKYILVVQKSLMLPLPFLRTRLRISEEFLDSFDSLLIGISRCLKRIIQGPGILKRAPNKNCALSPNTGSHRTLPQPILIREMIELVERSKVFLQQTFDLSLPLEPYSQLYVQLKTPPYTFDSEHPVWPQLRRGQGAQSVLFCAPLSTYTPGLAYLGLLSSQTPK